MKFLYLGLLIIVSLFIFAPNVSAQVVINEFLPDASPEWVEFFNGGTSTIDLSEYYFDDDTEFDSDSGSSKKIFLKGLLNSGATCFWELSTYLNNNGDSPTLFGEDKKIVDTYTYSSTIKDKSYSRVPDGGGWQVDQDPSKAPTSCKSLAPTPTPESTPTPTPGPTSTPTPTPTKTPTATPKPTVKAVVTKKPKVTSTKTTSDEEETEVLGLREGLEPPSPTPIPESEEKGKIPITAILFVLGGLGFMGVAGYPFLKSMKKRYNIKNEEETGAEGDFKSGDN